MPWMESLLNQQSQVPSIDSLDQYYQFDYDPNSTDKHYNVSDTTDNVLNKYSLPLVPEAPNEHKITPKGLCQEIFLSVWRL